VIFSGTSKDFRIAPDSLEDYSADPAYRQLLASLASGIINTRQQNVVVIGIAGAQGSGKTTLARALGEVLVHRCSLGTARLSLDDFYLTRDERTKLAADKHPLLATRGVPGTHDIAWMQQSIESLRQGLSTEVPEFDKATDDRVQHLKVLQPVDVVICEGWCWGAVPEPLDRLETPVNELEADLDIDGTWRRFVNDQLLAYQELFKTDGFVFIKVPSMDAVVQWRWQQEQELDPGAGKHVMNEAELNRFIQYYQRLTCWMLETAPEQADMCVTLDHNHSIAGVEYADSGTIQ
jgi:D-glycerate 3-kinase